MTDLKDLTWPAADYSRVPYGVFTDPDVYELEQERIFKGPVWIYLALEAEIPNPGDFLVTYVGDTPAVVNRAEDGSIHAWVNRCAHRGTMVVREPRGNRTTHTCVYHHWCYDLEGNLIGVPFQKGSQGQGGMPASFRKEDHSLQRYRVATYRGAIFGASHPDVEPLEDFLGSRMREFLDYMFREPIEILGYMRQRMPANWKIYYENLMDGWHGGLLHQLPVVFGIHRVTQAGGQSLDQHKRHVAWRVIHGSDDEETVRAGYDDTTLMNETPELHDPCIVDWRDEQNDGQILNMMAIFPSVLFQQLSNTLATRQIRPTRPGRVRALLDLFRLRERRCRAPQDAHAAGQPRRTGRADFARGRRSRRAHPARDPPPKGEPLADRHGGHRPHREPGAPPHRGAGPRLLEDLLRADGDCAGDPGRRR